MRRDGAVVKALAPHQCGPGFKSRRRRHMWVAFVVGSLPCSKRFFSGYFGSPPPSSKTNISKFQFDQESGRRRTTLWMSYLQIIIIVVNRYYYSYGNQYFLAWFSLRKGKRFVSKKEIYLSLTFTQWLGFLAHNCKMVCWKRMKAFLCFVFIYIYL